jgi:Bacterial Ig-like domain
MGGRRTIPVLVTFSSLLACTPLNSKNLDGAGGSTVSTGGRTVDGVGGVGAGGMSGTGTGGRGTGGAGTGGTGTGGSGTGGTGTGGTGTGGRGTGGSGIGGANGGAGGAGTLTVLSHLPADQATISDIGSVVSVTFSATVDATTLTTGTFTVFHDNQIVAGSINAQGATVKFTPMYPWSLATAYTVQLTAAITDVTGRPLTATTFGFSVREGAWTASRISSLATGAPRVALAPNGNGALVWSLDQNAGVGALPNIFASRYAPGGIWTSPVQISTGTNSPFHSRAQVAINDRAHVVAVWDYYDSTQASYFLTGPDWTAPSTWDLSSYVPQVALNANDQVYSVVWANHSTPIIDAQLAMLPDALGSNITSIPALGTTLGTSPQIALLGPQGAMVIWSQDAGGGRTDIWAKQFGTTSGSAQAQVISSQTAAASNPQIASDASGNAVVVWQQADPDWTNIWAARFTGTWGSPIIASDRTSSASAPVLAVDGLGRALAAWQQSIAGTTRIVSSSYVPGGTWSASAVVSDASGAASAPSLSLDAMGNGIAAWTEANVSITNVWVARYIDVKGWQPTLRKMISDATISATNADVAMDASGRAFVAFSASSATGSGDGSVWIGRFE